MIIKIYDGVQEPYKVNLNTFGKNIVRFGRSSDNDIVLSSENVSRQHGCFKKTENGWIIQDMQSTNGLIRNEEKIKQCSLKEGSTISIPHSKNNGNDVKFVVSKDTSGNEIEKNKSEKVVSKVVYRVPKKMTALICGMAAVIILCLVLFILINTKKPKGAYTIQYTDESETAKQTIIFDHGTYMIRESFDYNEKYYEDWADPEDYEDAEGWVEFGIYTVEDDIIYLKPLEMTADYADLDDVPPYDECRGMYDKSNDAILFYHSSYYSEVDSDEIYESESRKEKAVIDVDRDYLETFYSKIQQAGIETEQKLGTDAIVQEQGDYWFEIQPESFENPKTQFEKTFVEKLDYQNDETLQQLIENDVIYIDVHLNGANSDFIPRCVMLQ